MDTKQFLQHFPNFCIQTFDDNQEKGHEKDNSLTVYGKPSDFTKERIKELNDKGAGIYFTPNAFPTGERKAKLCTRVNAWIVEMDNKDVDSQWKRVEQAPLKPSFIVQSKNGLHVYWLANGASIDNYRIIVKGLIDFFDGDVACKDISRVLRTPGFYHKKDPNNPFLIGIVDEHPERNYNDEEMKKAFPFVEEVKIYEPKNIRTDDFWGCLGSLDNKMVLQRMTGSPIVNSERIDFSKRTAGGEYILVDGKMCNAWLDDEGMIGSGAGGGPTWIQWLGYYNREKSEIAKWAKESLRDFIPIELLEEKKEMPIKVEDTEFLSFTEVLELSCKELLETNNDDIISYGYEWLDYRLTGIFPSELTIIGGESGCLHPDTEIYDPVSQTRLTVSERHKLGKEFSVYSKNNKGEIIITKAEPPRKFFKTKMYELKNGENKIIVTGKHRVWDGVGYTKVCDLAKSSVVLLPTISEQTLSRYVSGDYHLKKRVSNFQFCCHLLSRLCGQLLQFVKGICLVFSPLRAYVHEHSCDCPCKGGLENELRHNHLCPDSAHHSKQGCLPQNCRKIYYEFYTRLTQGISSRFFQRHPLFYRFYSYLSLAYAVICKYLSFLVSKVCGIFRNFLQLFLSYNYKVNNEYFNYTTWGVKEQQDEVYFDFTVPVYKNYWAEGLFHHNTGKTTFATNIIYKASKQIKCGVYALEDRLEDYGIKALFFKVNEIKNGIAYPWNDFRRNKIKDKSFPKLLMEAKQKLANENIKFAKVEKQMTIERLEALIEKQASNGVKLFLIDHLHYFDLTRGGSSKADHIEQTMVRLKTLLNRLQVSALLIVHYRKLNGQKPTMDSFKDSISIVQNANYVINLWRDRSEDANQLETLFLIPKARNPNGEGTIHVTFNPEINDYKQKDDWAFGTEQPGNNSIADIKF